MPCVPEEPSIDLNQRESDKLLVTRKELRDPGNSARVIKHNLDVIR